jgi:SET domain-containing protein
MTSASRRRVSVRPSLIHGHGLYALVDLSPNEQILEFHGEVITWDAAMSRCPDGADEDESLTYFFERSDGMVIDRSAGGNSTRFINHSCEPNCEAIEVEGRIYLHAAELVRAGEELLIDYALFAEEPNDAGVRARYSCNCSAAECRMTMLAPR